MKRVGKATYELEFPAELAGVHQVFYITLLQKCVGNPASIVPIKCVAVKYSILYEDVPVEILDCQVRRLKKKGFVSVKF